MRALTQTPTPPNELHPLKCWLLTLLWRWDLCSDKWTVYKHIDSRGGNCNRGDDTILSRYLGHDRILLRFFTFYDTASIAIRFCDTLQFLSPIYYVLYTRSLCSHRLLSILTSFPISTVTLEKNEVLHHIVDFRSNASSRQTYVKSQYSLNKLIYDECIDWNIAILIDRCIDIILCQNISRFYTVSIISLTFNRFSAALSNYHRIDQTKTTACQSKWYRSLQTKSERLSGTSDIFSDRNFSGLMQYVMCARCICFTFELI